MDQNSQNIDLIKNSRTAWPTLKIGQAVLSFWLKQYFVQIIL